MVDLQRKTFRNVNILHFLCGMYKVLKYTCFAFELFAMYATLARRDQDKIRNYMDRRVTPLRRVTSPTWGPPPPCKQALRQSKNGITCL